MKRKGNPRFKKVRRKGKEVYVLKKKSKKKGKKKAKRRKRKR